jgi:hypothetical protein
MASAVMLPLLTEASRAMIGTIATAPLSSNQVLEYVNVVALTETTPLSALTEAGYDGYARGTIASWLGPELDLQNDLVVVPAAAAVFSCSGHTTVQSVIGCAILDSTGTTLLAAAEYATPISPLPGQVHRVSPAVGLAGEIDLCLC